MSTAREWKERFEGACPAAILQAIPELIADLASLEEAFQRERGQHAYYELLYVRHRVKEED